MHIDYFNIKGASPDMAAPAGEPERTAEDEQAERERQNSSATLLNIPAEIRNQIYSTVLPSEGVWHITGESYYEIRQSNSKPDKRAFVKSERTYDLDFDEPLALSRCCRQLRTESLRFYYGFNSFVLPVAPEDIETTSQWLSKRPAEFYTVVRKVYFQQTLRRCHRFRTPGYERLLLVDLKTLEVEIIGKLRHCSSCLERYERQVERAKERRSFKQMQTKWLGEDLSCGRLVELAKLFSRQPGSSKPEQEGREDDPFPGLMLLFDALESS